MSPSQSLSTPSHFSSFTDSGHSYSQPGVSGSRSAYPLRQSTTHSPPSQVENAFGTLQTMPQPPQLLGSLSKSKPSLDSPSQSSSSMASSHTSMPWVGAPAFGTQSSWFPEQT